MYHIGWLSHRIEGLSSYVDFFVYLLTIALSTLQPQGNASSRKVVHLVTSRQSYLRTSFSLAFTYPRRHSIQLYTVPTGSAQPELYARVTRAEGSVTLEIVAEAIQKGLLEVCIVAVVLMLSGRSID